MSAPTPTPETTPTPNPMAESVASLLKGVLDQREAALLGDFRKKVLELSQAKPVIDPLGGRQPGEPAPRQPGEPREPGPIVSRHQPTDLLYERLYRREPLLEKYRSSDQDYWGKQWLLGLAGRNHTVMAVAKDKLDEIDLRRGVRATTLEGGLDASDPTAILSGTGGHLLPQNMANVLMIARDKAAVLPSLCMVYDMASKTLRIPTASAVTVYMVAEGATATQGEPTFGTELLDAEKMQAYMLASVEMLADTPFNLMNIYAERSGSAMGAMEDTQICTSNGTSPNISEAIAGGNVAEATTGTLIYEDLVSLFFALTKPYRPTAVWLGSSATLAGLSKLMDGNDRPILAFPTQQVAPVGDTPGIVGTIFSKPVYEVPLADGVVLFGDVRQGYAFGRRQGIVASVSEHVQFSADLVAFKFTQRIDGRIQDDAAMKQIAGITVYA